MWKSTPATESSLLSEKRTRRLAPGKLALGALALSYKQQNLGKATFPSQEYSFQSNNLKEGKTMYVQLEIIFKFKALSRELEAFTVLVSQLSFLRGLSYTFQYFTQLSQDDKDVRKSLKKESASTSHFLPTHGCFLPPTPTPKQSLGQKEWLKVSICLICLRSKSQRKDEINYKNRGKEKKRCQILLHVTQIPHTSTGTYLTVHSLTKRKFPIKGAECKQKR